MTDEIAYEEFGRRFFEHAVTQERVLAGFSGLTGEPIAFGPIGAGPGRIAKVSADGRVGEPTIEQTAYEPITFALTIGVQLELQIDLGLDKHTFQAELAVGLTLRARAVAPLRLVIDVEPPSSRDVEVAMTAEAMRSEVLRRVAGMDREIARFVARYIAREVDKPHIRAARDIDVAARIESAYRP